MFYSQFILAKKGPLGTIWIAAHLERKLRKNQVADTDIGVSVDSILCPDVPIALRLSSHLLLGVVRIYSRKVNYLFDDCSEALLKVKQAFRSTAVDLPPEQSKAPYHSITLPETFDLDDFELPDNEIFQGNDRHVSTREQITLQDTMEGVAFPTSQFGLDERFGDGDASQIGLDLDEDLFMEKGDAAGTSGNVNNTDADLPAKEATSLKDDEHSDMVSDLPLPSSTNYFSIQAPSTPGLMEEPDLPSAQEALVSDDHMDEDQHIPEMATKEVSGTASSQVEPACMHSLEINSNGDCHSLDEQENEQVKSERSILPNEAAEATSPGNAQPLESVEHIGAVNGVDSSGNKLDHILLQNEGIAASDSQFIRELCEYDEADLNTAGKVTFTEVHDQYTCADGEEADRDGSDLPGTAIRSENNNSLDAQEFISFEESETVLENKGYQCPKSDQPCQNLETWETSENTEVEKSLDLKTPVLKPCNSHSHNICGVENMPDCSKVAEDDGLFSLGLSSKQDAAEILTDVHDLTMSNVKEYQIAHEGADAITSNLDGPLGGDHLEKENNYKASDFSAPEKLLSMPDLPAGQSDNVFVECTPGIGVVGGDSNCIEVVAGDGDASFENLLSGKKRSYTESTLTVQSLNSAASSGAAQSKQPAELIPDDDDLLSSILGGRSTAFKLKPTPPVADSLPAKRQRSSVRPSAQKRKVLVDDSMVLHGDMIREQLTNTEDIRRVRKKAPCTRLEIWVLQKQFLEDEVFGESVFTGLLPEFRCLHSQTHDLSGIRIVQGDGSKGTNETGTSSMLMHAQGVATETPVSSAAGANDKEEREDNLDALQKELETFDNEVAKQMSKQVPGEKADVEYIDQAGCEGNEPVAPTAELTSSMTPVPEVTCNLTDNTTVDAPHVYETNVAVVSAGIDASCPFVNEANDAVVSAEIDASCPSVNVDNRVEFSMEVDCTMEVAKESGRQNQEVVDVNVDDKSDDKTLLEKREGDITADATAVMEDVQGTCSSPVFDIPVVDSVELEGKVSPTSDRIMEECQFGEPRFQNEEEIIASDLRQDENCPASNNFFEEDVKLDPSPVAETDLSFRDAELNEMENMQCLETDPTLLPDSTIIPTEFTNPTDHSDFGMEAFEHDTGSFFLFLVISADFLNVDDDDVAEDYEDDTPNPEEKRMLDNSGWSSRTRAVANYLQVLFVKETHQAQKIIPLESLLAGKTRKEASRMFFETLVLKTKDYIRTEQEGSFGDIKIKPTGKLMKSEF
ncbi:hypothetical protein RND81_04G232500 [Saponaria officinalis]|uniref:Sister chromatid cohesion 1 protein 4-like n=1 Tax=Saponaria officinalis TaxID=3572 RepID=A0AAW1LL12_SAPOF